MAITVHPPGKGRTPTEQVVDEASKIIRFTTPGGLSLGIRRIDMSMKRRVFKAISAKNQEKEQYLGLVMLAASVCEIEGESVRVPSSEILFDALIDRLDDDGMNAISLTYREHFRPAGNVETEAGE